MLTHSYFAVIISGYVRYCQLGYYLDSAVEKINTRNNSLTFDVTRNNRAVTLAEIETYKKHNNWAKKVCFLSAIGFNLAGNFRFYSSLIPYGIGLVTFTFATISYCSSMVCQFLFWYLLKFSIWYFFFILVQNYVLSFTKLQVWISPIVDASNPHFWINFSVLLHCFCVNLSHL